MNYGTYGGPGRPGGRPSSAGYGDYNNSNHGNQPRRTNAFHQERAGGYGVGMGALGVGNGRTGGGAARGPRAGLRRPRPSPELNWNSPHALHHQRDPQHFKEPGGVRRNVFCGPPRFEPPPQHQAAARCRRHSCNGALRPLPHHSPPHHTGSNTWGVHSSQSSGLGSQSSSLGSQTGSLSSQSSASSSGYSGAADEITSSESEMPSSSELGDPSSGGDPADAELSQVIPRIIKPRKRRKKEKRPKIPRMAAAEEQRRAAERRPSSLGSTSSAESAVGGSWCLGTDSLTPEQLDLLCQELTALRMRRHLTPPGDLLTPSGDLMTPPASPGAGCLRRSRSDPNHHHRCIGEALEDVQGFSCPSSLEFRDSAVNTAQPPQRTWHPLGRPSSTHSTCIFTVMCYNVLCEKYATRQMYGYCPNWALEWDYRKKIIMQEIRNYSADIITLQEVQTDQFYNFFLPTLQRDKYEGIFSPKSRAKTMAESERKFVDGCAIFWRTEKFTLVKDYLVEFNQLAMANAEGSDDMLNRVMTKDNIGLAAMLETREAAWESGPEPAAAQPSQRLLVCTAHIHWDPEFCDVKLIQTMMLMHEIKQIIDQASREPPSFRPGGGHRSGNSIQLLLCGDLNSLPDSGVVEFLVNGRIPANHNDFKELGYRTCLKKLSSSERNTAEYTHPFRLASSYNSDIMPYTNYTYDFKGIIDYIFFNRDTMTPLGVLGPLDQDWLRENKVQGCPHPHVPSDHFSLLVELEMSPSRADPATSANGLIAHR